MNFSGYFPTLKKITVSSTDFPLERNRIATAKKQLVML